MATKREVMLAGTPAKLAHMLASDSPNVLAPQGSDQDSAALIETNFQVLYGSDGTGVRLRPASGQYLHFLFNANFDMVAVYPDGTESINDMPPGEPFLLEPLMALVLAPARRQWIGGQLSGGATGAGAPNIIYLTGPTTFYVAPTGMDVPGNGLSPLTPVATVGYILNLLRTQYNLNMQVVTIQLANGNYTEAVYDTGAMAGLQGAAGLVILGNSANPSMVTWNADPCLNCANGSLLTVQGVTMQSTVSQCIIAQNHARIFFQNIIFGQTSGSHLLAAQGGIIHATGNYTISGGAGSHIFAAELGQVIIDAGPGNFNGYLGHTGVPTITITGTPSFTGEFIFCQGADVRMGATFNPPSGGATGKQYHVTFNGVVNIIGQSLTTYLPGNIAGDTLNGGVIG